MSNLKALILLKSTSLDIYQDGLEDTSVTFFEDSIMHLEIMNKEKFVSTLSDFIKHLKPEPAVLMLSDEVLFQKTLESSSEDFEQKKQEFFEKIPFQKNKVAKKEIISENQVFLFATNRDLYEVVVETFVTHNWKIDIVSPVSIFPSLTQKSKLTKEEVSEVLQNKDALEKSNFIAGQEFVTEEEIPEAKVEEEEVIEGSSGISLKTIISILVILVLLGGFGVVAYQFRQNFKSPRPPQQVIEDYLKTPEPQSTQSAVKTIPRKELSIQVLNGSGVSGQAGSIKNSLSQEGFENIEAGNFDGDNIPETIATFSARVESKDQEAVMNILTEIFGKVLQKTTSSSSIDISIVTGTNIK